MPTPEVSRRVHDRLDDMYRRHLNGGDDGPASYYGSGRGYYGRELAGDQPDQFGVCLAALDGDLYSAGDHGLAFGLQSISKVFAYALALADNGREEVLRSVGVEPSGDSFNSITFD